MQAYTYSIYHKVSNRYYYGVRKSTVFDVGVVYFSSSKLVKRMLAEGPPTDFVFKLRRKFDSYEQARLHETKLLQRINAVSNPKMLNQAVSSSRIPSKDSTSEQARRANISARMTALWATPGYRASNSFVTLDAAEASRRGKLGSAKRIEGYASGRIARKERKKPIYKDVTITRGDETKTVKANQVPQYQKFGWLRT